MSTTTTAKVLIRNARDQDIPAVTAIEGEAFSASGTAQQPETFQQRLRAFPDGFIILIAENEIAAYGCSEKWLTEREPVEEDNPLRTHQPDGRILYISGMAVRKKDRGKGYGLLVLDKLLEIAHREGCRKIIVQTPDAQALFQKRDFKTVKTGQSRMEGGASPDVMSLEIESYGSKA